MKVLSLTPPMTQLNTPYPATAYLTGFLRHRASDLGVQAFQADPALELVLRLFSKKGLERVKEALDPSVESVNLEFFKIRFETYRDTVEPVIRFLQGKNPTLAMRITSRKFLPEGSRFRALYEFSQGQPGGDTEQLQWAFGAIGSQDQAKYLASLYLDDLADVIKEGIDPRFEFSRYGEKLAASQATFDFLEGALKNSTPTLVDEILDEITQDLLNEHQPDLLICTAPFPGNVYGAFRIAQKIKSLKPKVKTLLGGGYVNTELRELKDPRVFDYFDAITLDDGEKPLQCLVEFYQGKRDEKSLLRTFLRRDNRVVYFNSSLEHDIPQKDTGCPTYDGLKLDQYLSILELPNPMHRIWSDGRWNKLTLAHGCYWKKCSFCDVNLDYIGRYEANPIDTLVDRMVKIADETGQTGFHFVDEAAPPAVLKALSQRLIERGLQFTWWGNIRFEKSFNKETCELLARAGCVAVSGGLEVASDRLLKMMSKGVTVEQVARVTNAFTQAGIFVHAYLMFGFPTQTVQETVDALERVRQLFEANCIQSAFWHRFSVTAHSPIGKNPKAFGIKILPEPAVSFARNDLAFEDPAGTDHEMLGVGLKRALYNYMHGVGIDQDVRLWFDVKVPKAKVSKDFIFRALSEGTTFYSSSSRVERPYPQSSGV